MKPTDDIILEYLKESGAGTPQSIASEIERNNDYIGVRCRTLTNYNLLERPARGLYNLTDQGRAYLAGELDASDLEGDDGE